MKDGNVVLRKAAQELGMTQVAIAEALDVSEAAVSKWFAGLKRPRPDIAKRLAELLKVTLDDVYR